MASTALGSALSADNDRRESSPPTIEEASVADSFAIRVDDMPAEMRVLMDEYSRETWKAHPGFRETTRNWLVAHQMFRRLAATIRTDTEDYLDDRMPAERFAHRIAYHGNALVRNLHGHHDWEDHSYFPELSAADSRFDAGLEILQKDHQDLNVVLDRFTTVANRVIKLVQLEETSAKLESGDLLVVAQTIERFLARHLSDEEELAVPVILHHRLRG